MTVTCPKCGKPAVCQETRYGPRNECCGLWSWGNAPLVSADTHEARKKAHLAFDALWKKYGMPRSYAYARLAEKLHLSPEGCHMKLMDRETAGKVPLASLLILSDWLSKGEEE